MFWLQNKYKFPIGLLTFPYLQNKHFHRPLTTSWMDVIQRHLVSIVEKRSLTVLPGTVYAVSPHTTNTTWKSHLFGTISRHNASWRVLVVLKANVAVTCHVINIEIGLRPEKRHRPNVTFVECDSNLDYRYWFRIGGMQQGRTSQWVNFVSQEPICVVCINPDWRYVCFPSGVCISGRFRKVACLSLWLVYGIAHGLAK